jgi:hypothetical protein
MVDRDDTGHRFGDVGIETLYDGMTMAAAEKTSVQRARQRDVVDKLARPDEHWSVFEARNRFADHHDLPLKRRPGLAAGLELLHAGPGNDLAIRWELARNMSHVTPRRRRRSSARHLLGDVRHAFRAARLSPDVVSDVALCA